MKSLTTLIKLQKTRVDEQRQALAKLQAHLAEIEQNIAMLEIKKAREQAIVQEHAEARMTYGAFLKAAVRDGRAFEKQRVIVLDAIKSARAKLAELFEEQKRYEIAAEAREMAETRETRRRETIELDEVGSVTYIRKKE